MGPITGLATIATTLLVAMLVLGVAVVGLTLGVVLPALARSRDDRIDRGISVPAYYLPAAVH